MATRKASLEIETYGRDERHCGPDCAWHKPGHMTCVIFGDINPNESLKRVENRDGVWHQLMIRHPICVARTTRKKASQ